MLKEVQDGLVVNDEVLSKNNPLFVVNGRSQRAAQLPVVRQQQQNREDTMHSSTAHQTRQQQAR
jgi:hypothetical protein